MSDPTNPPPSETPWMDRLDAAIRAYDERRAEQQRQAELAIVREQIARWDAQQPYPKPPPSLPS